MQGNFNYTKGVYLALKCAREVSGRYNLTYIGTEEILYGLLCTPKCDACAYLKKFGIDKEIFFSGMKSLIKPIKRDGYTPLAKSVLAFAQDIAAECKVDYVSTEHLLLAILKTPDCNACGVLRSVGADVDKLCKYTILALHGRLVKTENEESSYISTSNNYVQEKQENNNSEKFYSKPIENENSSSKEKFVVQENEDEKDKNTKYSENEKTPLDGLGYDLTLKAKQGKLDPVIGRDKEIQRVIQTLSRRTKNSPVLIGEPGVGKSAVVEGLATLMISGEIPENLRGKKIFSLDVASLLAGTKYRGDFEEKIKSAIKYATENKNVIFFIDEIHNIVGAGSTSDSNLDVAELLKPLLSRGELSVIGATTVNEYRKYIEKDSALERRFQPIMIEPPSVEETIEILKGLKDRYEAHHKVEITEEAIIAAANLTDRYVQDRFLPDKAIDAIDECASKMRIALTSTPQKIIGYERNIRSLTAERDYSLSRQDLDTARKLDEKISELNSKINDEKIKQYNKRAAGTPKITEKEIAELISEWTDIPLTDISTAESKKLLDLEDDLHSMVIGQEDAVRCVARAIRRARAMLKDPDKPIGSFIFVGPTGVGKSELSKALAKCVFGNENSLIRIDMTEFTDGTSVNKLIGSAPGYVGYEEEGQLTEKIRRKPYSVVLFDEIEKAHPDIFNLLLQVLDEGRLTDSKGRLVSFKNSIIILTSNIGYGDNINKVKSVGFGNTETLNKEKVYDALKEKFRAEFLNRLDDIVVFEKLSKENCYDIADILLNKLIKRMNTQGYFLTVDNSAVDLIIKEGYSETYGARPLKRAIERYIEDMLSEEIIVGNIKTGDNINVYGDCGAIKYKKG